MLLDQVKARIEGQVPELDKRLQFARDLAALVEEDAFPQSVISGFLLASGLRPLDRGSAGTGFFIQSCEETVSVVLVFYAAGDVTGGKSIDRDDPIVAAVIDALVGWMPESDQATRLYTTDFALAGANVGSLVQGRVIYEIDVTVGLQLRILAS